MTAIRRDSGEKYSFMTCTLKDLEDFRLKKRIIVKSDSEEHKSLLIPHPFIAIKYLLVSSHFLQYRLYYILCNKLFVIFLFSSKALLSPTSTLNKSLFSHGTLSLTLS